MNLIRNIYNNYFPTLTKPEIRPETNLATISQEYLIPMSKLIEKQEDGQLANYIAKESRKYSPILKSANVEYKKITSFYNRNDDGLLTSKDLSIHESDLMKIVKKSLLVISTESDKNIFLHVSLNNQPNSKFFTKLEDQKIVIFEMKGGLESKPGDAVHLGSGAAGTVQKVDLLTKGRLAALKIANSSEYSLYREFVVNKSVQNQKNKAIQKAPVSLGTIHKNDDKVSAMLTPFYDSGDLNEFRKNILNSPTLPLPTKRKILQDFTLQMIEGTKVLHDQDVIHGDIKTFNFLVRKTKNGNHQVSLADLGGSLLKNELKRAFDRANSNYFGTSALTSAFIPKEIHTKLVEAKNKNDFEGWKQLNKSRDVFALASSVWHFLTGNIPYALEGKYPKIDPTAPLINSETMKSLLSPEAFDILHKTLTSKPEDIPSIDELDRIFKENSFQQLLSEDLNTNENLVFMSFTESSEESLVSSINLETDSDSTTFSQLPEIPFETDSDNMTFSQLPEIPFEEELN